jgi:hypothetical protein
MKGKVHPSTDHEGREGEYRYSCVLTLTWAVDGVGDQRDPFGRFIPAKETQYLLYRRLGAPGRSGLCRKFYP